MGIFVSRNGFSKPCYNFVKKYDDIFLINLEEENIINRIKSYYNLISKEYQIQEDECYIQYSSSSSFKINISFNYILIFFILILLYITCRLYLSYIY